MTERQKQKGTSIKRSLVFLLLIVLVPAIAIQAYFSYNTYQTRRASELQANLEIARSLAKAFESFVQDVLRQELAIGLAITSSHRMNSRDITRLLETGREYQAVRDFVWLNPKGVAVYSSNPHMVGLNYSDRLYFQDVVNGREWIVSELIIAKSSGKPVFAISRGIRNGKGILLGVIYAVILPEKLGAHLVFERSKGGAHSLIDNKGMLVYRYPAIDATWEERNWLKPYPEFEDALKGKEVVTTVYAPFEGKNRLAAVAPVSSIGWGAGAGTREEEVLGPILSSIGKNALLFLSITLIAFFLAFAVSRRITHPVTTLHAHALALGNGTQPGHIKVDYVSEFQDLAETFNLMAEKVHARERELRESEERERERASELATFLDAAPTPVFIIHNTEGTHITGNRAADELLKLPRDGEVSMSAPVGVRPHHYKAVKDGRELRIDELPARRAARGEEVRDFEFSIVFADGTIRQVMGYGTPLFDENGQPRGAIHTLVDITDRKRTEEALRESEARLTLSMIASRSGTFDWDIRTNVNTWSDEIVVLYGVKREEFAGTFEGWFECILPEDRERGREAIARSLETGLYEFEFRIRRRDIGEVRWMYGRGQVFKDDEGRPLRMIGTNVDITERKLAEEELRRHAAQLEAAYKEMESFSYSVSHDLRAPLRAIDGFSMMLLKKHGEQFDEESRRKFNVIRSNAQMMGQLINDILTLSRLGRQKMSIELLDMDAVVQDVWKELHIDGQDREINFTINSMPSGHGDRILIKQVYLNLLSNAVKFTKYRDPAIIEVGGRVDGDENVYHVKDNGVGFDMTYYDKLFGAFQRLHKPDKFEGTGIGLATIQRVIQRHGGRAWAEGKVDEGATFYFSLPLSHTRTHKNDMT
ncbi:MAG TPA: PAS domain-containing protein [Syntrophales bacterium]|nr:PAS domain-containing protein [Syntrophales bacterium]